VNELGGLEILVNNAAYQMERDSFLDILSQELDFVFKANMSAMFHLCKAAVPHMPPGSAIINTTSIQAFHGPYAYPEGGHRSRVQMGEPTRARLSS
jgi:NAD(P)-dependent dehydrogenase (short-subunit alcohol dehydrogenase family)